EAGCIHACQAGCTYGGQGFAGCAVRSHSGVRGLWDQHYGEPGQPGLCSVCVHHRHGNLSAGAAWDPLQPRPGSAPTWLDRLHPEWSVVHLFPGHRGALASYRTLACVSASSYCCKTSTKHADARHSAAAAGSQVHALLLVWQAAAAVPGHECWSQPAGSARLRRLGCGNRHVPPDVCCVCGQLRAGWPGHQGRQGAGEATWLPLMCPSPACGCQDREGHAARLKPRL
ncbi:hypothetical protein COO60DRAFT_1667221, partial [Scenedesmus sp. NREL 46B-D3]